MAKLLTTLKFGEWLPDVPEYDNPRSPMIVNAGWDCRHRDIMADLAAT